MKDQHAETQLGGFIQTADDLSRLKIVSAEKVKAFAAEANAISADVLKQKKLVIAIATGGTIAMTLQNSVLVPALDFSEIVALASPTLEDKFLVKGLDAFNIDSSQMDFGHVRELAIVLTYLWKNIKHKHLGFMITHGTDTMQYSSSALSLIMGQGLPFSVVYTGAQKPIVAPLTDAANNIQRALYTLETLYEHNMAEVVLVMGRRAILATSAEKVDDERIDAFDAPIHQYIARYDRLEYPVQLAPWLKERRAVPFAPTIWEGDDSHTLVVKSTMGLSADLVSRQAADPHIRAVVLYTYGGSTIYRAIVEKIIPVARARRVPVFAVSPVYGNIKTTYESGEFMKKQGIIPLFMTLPTTLAKIEIALRKFPNDEKAMADFMMASYVGEVPSEQSHVKK